MFPRFFFTLSLLAILMASCAPTAVTTESPPQPVPSTVVEPRATPILSVTTEGQILETPAQTPLPIATSRGPDLEATDPSTVNLASGDLQFVEFFRFT